MPGAENSTLARFDRQPTVRLTTFKRDGTPVGTPVNIAVEGDHAYVRSWRTAGKSKRLRNNPAVTIEPSTFRGRPTGEPVAAHAERIEGDEAEHAADLLTQKHHFVHGFAVPLVHRLKGLETVYFRVEAA